jgi:hypothetical protein
MSMPGAWSQRAGLALPMASQEQPGDRQGPHRRSLPLPAARIKGDEGHAVPVPVELHRDPACH